MLNADLTSPTARRTSISSALQERFWPPQQHVHRTRIGRMRVHGCQYHRPNIRPVQPVPELAADHPSRAAAAAAGDDFDATQPVGLSGPEEVRDRVERLLRRQAMQVQRPAHRQLAGAETLPARPIHAARCFADRQR